MKCKKIMHWHSRLPSHPPPLQKPPVCCRRTAFRWPYIHYTQTVSRALRASPYNAAANSSYAAQVVSLVNAERARQGCPR